MAVTSANGLFAPEPKESPAADLPVEPPQAAMAETRMHRLKKLMILDFIALSSKDKSKSHRAIKR